MGNPWVNPHRSKDLWVKTLSDFNLTQGLHGLVNKRLGVVGFDWLSGFGYLL